MKHAERLAERIVYLGGIPTYQPSAVKRGGDLRKMIQDDLDAENAA
ncbi:MAG: ferritin, partial [candidate division NC10 bacterium]|nr:ferritin [candidate division NC10 bacterium]